MEIKIMRGIPGSGKSTYARKLAEEVHESGVMPLICSADEFFITANGYEFDPKRLGEAHQYCMRRFLTWVGDKYPFIIVDNTNINTEDISPYVVVGEALGYDVRIIQVNIDPETAAKRNLHGVPRQKVFDMFRRLIATPIPGKWKCTNVLR